MLATVALKIVQKIAALMTNVAPRLSKYSSNRIILVEAGELGPELSSNRDQQLEIPRILQPTREMQAQAK